MKKFNEQQSKGKIVIYTTKDGKTNLEVKLQKETVWLMQKQIAELFGTQRPAITKHLKNIFQSGELEENSVCSILEHTASDGKIYHTKFYNLDAIISVGYRVNSQQATRFRIWATKIIKDYLQKGFALNQKRLQEIHFKELEQAVSLFQKTMSKRKLQQDEAVGLLKVITDYTQTWVLLYKYDKESLDVKKQPERLNIILIMRKLKW